MASFKRKQKEEPKQTEHPERMGKCPVCGQECKVIDYGAFLGYFCPKCGPTMDICVKDK